MTRLARQEEIRDAVTRLFPSLRAHLEQLVQIPSISMTGFDTEPVKRSALATRQLFEAIGLQAQVVATSNCDHPSVIARSPDVPGMPRVLLYAHHDVQPTGPRELWRSNPFELVERDNRLYGRGASDDKAGVVIHLGALAAHNGHPPVAVTVLLDGEEEAGSPHLGQLLSEHASELQADVVIFADMANWAVGEPALTTSLRGLVNVLVEVRTLDHALHSGEFGGVIPDALTTLVRLLATLHDDNGNVTIPSPGAATIAMTGDLTELELRRVAGVRPSVRLIGEGGIMERTWRRSAVSVLGIDAPRTADAPNQLVPAASAKVSMRIVPGENVDSAFYALAAHLKRNDPWGAEIAVLKRETAEPFAATPKGATSVAIRNAMRFAWGREPVYMGGGGSIPAVALLAQANPNAEILLTGAADPTSSPHSENESVDIDDLERAIVAEAVFLDELVA